MVTVSEPHQDSLSLIVLVMREQKALNFVLPTRVAQRAIPESSGLRLEIAQLEGFHALGPREIQGRAIYS